MSKTNPLEEMARAFSKSDSALLSAITFFIAVLLKNGRIKREDIELWIEALKRYANEKGDDPKSDASMLRPMIRRLHRSLLGDQKRLLSKTLH